MTKVFPAYNYTGVCQQYATYGRVRGADVQKPAQGEVLQTIDLAASGVFSYGGEIEETSTFELSRPVKYRGQEAIHLSGVPVAKNDPAINQAEPNPYIGGLGISYAAAPAELTGATHVRLKVFPRTSATLVLEIYENDGGAAEAIDKDPGNFWLPKQDDDFFKVVIKLEPTGRWQTLTIPVAKLVDWNKKTDCSSPIPGINENIGNGKFDPKKGEALAVQLTFVSDNWGPESKDIYLSKEVQFIREVKQ